MARKTARIGLGTLGLLAGLGAPRLAAQAWALPASDPVGIARSGAGVAYGNNLEAAGLNPALLATLRDGNSAYVSAGMELQAAKTTLQSNQEIQFSSDRNRFLAGLGAAWRLSPSLVLGLKFDEPFMKHDRMPLGYTGRFAGQAFDLNTHRIEAQIGVSTTPNWAFGAGVGITQIQYSWDAMVRAVVDNPNTSSPMGLMESDLHQEGKAYAPSYSLGFRWAPNSRWTVGGAYVGFIKTNLPLQARQGSSATSFYGLSGYGPAPVGTEANAPALGYHPGSGSLTLPGKLTLGVRQRVSKLFTWELDLRYVLGAQTELPGQPTATLAGGSTIAGPSVSSSYRNGIGMSLMGELDLSKRWVLRLGGSLDSAPRQDGDVEPLTGGAKSSGFSGGVGFKVFSGELNAGYQYRQTPNVNTPNLNYTWPASGYALAPGITRVEAMGHLWSVGFKRSF